ncbi:rhodanese-like domain-containing protein [Arcobacter sp. FWKO B]|uniref:rhodanese-like domain-containing protein n=1 Tax=Arcobacter sp. FWKO B TaxID=2593672 RepID=UPI0018A50BC7|nr:rhodanese-like domain-containing protein [Arcobacter sp. FWKO B]QOG12134.1 rhodanese-like domain-containing protein [Arcobacter sp. FWKO B]
MKKFIKGLLAVALLSTSLFAASNLKIIKMEEAKKYYDEKSALFIDARPLNLYLRGTIPGAIYMDYKEYDKLKKFLPADKKVTIVTFCNGLKCEHSDHLAEFLQKDGYKNVLVYKGGYPEWTEKKEPAMGILKECKEESKEAYKPKRDAVTIKGATVHLIDGDDTMIDQFWFAPKVVAGEIPANVQLIDIRKADQFAEGHLPGAINVPLDADGKLDGSKLPKDKFNVVYCNTGMQSTGAVSSLKDNDGSVVYFDATIKCEGTKCTVEPNELL